MYKKNTKGRRKRGTGARGGRGRGKFNYNQQSHFNKKPRSDGNAADDFLPLVGGGDLSNPNAISDLYFGNINSAPNSMKMAALGRRRYKSGQFPNSDEDMNTKNLPLRKRPMIFVKSKEIYDPSKDLIDLLITKNNAKNNYQGTLETKPNDAVESQATNQVVDKLEVVENGEDGRNTDKNKDEKYSSDENEELLEEYDNTSSSDGYVSGEDLYNYDIDHENENILPQENIFFVDGQGTNINIENIPETIVGDENEKIKNTEFQDTLKIGKVQLNLVENGEDVELIPFKKKININNEKKIDLDTKMNRLNINEFFDKDEKSKTQKDTEYNNTTPKSENENENDEPEFGFLDADFVANSSEIEITNIALGGDFQNNMYYTKSFKYFGNYNFHWVDTDVVEDILGELGLPEERYASYFGFIKDKLVKPEEEPQPTYSDVYISESGDEYDNSEYFVNRNFDYIPSDHEEEMYSKEITDDMREGLEDLISYSTAYEGDRNMEYESHSIATKGKGKNRKLFFDNNSDMDDEQRLILQSKFSLRLDRKATKRKTKIDYLNEEHINSTDLLLKYPYGMHVENIKDEFKSYLSRPNQEFLVFPPFDSHGNQTIVKFSKHFNTKAQTRRKGKSSSVTVHKSKKTNRKSPNYGLIDQLCRQRRVFMRSDTRDPSLAAQDIDDENPKKHKYHVREGEIIGENAPEISHDNIGRRLLEKLGWKHGEGLGIHGNKGIVVPLQVTVKKTKKGLGHATKEP
ncbi:Sqs1p SCDLUD_003029 [Saccharomycodes ludwigii]|uniref:Sqs1p n=1 Tax=Saccharomycodes ludwigii TaxID=36035 RepID=UPI001E879EFA|nr:hypothetical protein SCDLUD_003029 [Saccharomycodes ludwigii]KAH3901532.1 hypothetical protein SCDLUD_003029 [Saccharomycodes ludwigii]